MIVEREWKDWEAAVMPSNAGPNQRREMRRAFYAGASMLFFALKRIMDADREPTDADLKKMNDIYLELEAFKNKVVRGEA